MLLAAGALSVLLAVGHSILGERLVFGRLRRHGAWTEAALEIMERRRWWAVRASWHLVTVLAFGVAGILLAMATGAPPLKWILAATFAVATVYWAIATRLGHPAWIALGVIGVIVLFSN